MTGPLAVTMGEPDGIGPEIAAKAWRAKGTGSPRFFVVGDLAVLGRQAPVAAITDPAETEAAFEKALPVLSISGETKASRVIAAIDTAAKLAMSGQAMGIVTNPIHKAGLYAAGFRDPGHTEYLARITGATARPVMMLTVPGLRVVPATIHIPLALVPSQISIALLLETASTLNASLIQDFGCTAPRIAIAGLNPHAGESGEIGTEERTIIIPAIAAMRAKGIDASGPFPADTLFHEAARINHDAVLCMYHDQALIPLKTLDFAHGVNVTLGLDIVRTSPDHGTAFDIAGLGKANPDSLIAALDLAAMIARNRMRKDRTRHAAS